MTKQTPSSQTANDGGADNPGGRFAGKGNAQNGKTRDWQDGKAGSGRQDVDRPVEGDTDTSG